jgi:adenylate cyclase
VPGAEIVLSYGESESRVPLAPNTAYGIGRGLHNAICIQSNRVSRDHALLKQDESGRFCVFDLGSRNGTLLNGRLLSGSATLNPGDVVTIGDASLCFLSHAAAEEASPDTISASTVIVSDIVPVTVLVMDIRNFTALAGELGPAKTADLMRILNEAAVDLLDRSSAWNKKFIGDAVMAIWVNRTAKARFRTIGAALQAAQLMAAAASQAHSTVELPAPIRTGFGINAGPASIGNVGAGTTVDCTALGDTINRAFRLEAATRSCDCDMVCGSSVRDALSPHVELSSFAHRRPALLKGYSEECDIYAMNWPDVTRLLEALSGTALLAS